MYNKLNNLKKKFQFWNAQQTLLICRDYNKGIKLNQLINELNDMTNYYKILLSKAGLTMLYKL